MTPREFFFSCTLIGTLCSAYAIPSSALGHQLPLRKGAQENSQLVLLQLLARLDAPKPGEVQNSLKNFGKSVPEFSLSEECTTLADSTGYEDFDLNKSVPLPSSENIFSAAHEKLSGFSSNQPDDFHAQSNQFATAHRTTSTYATALALHKIIGKNCINAAHKLHATLAHNHLHPYLKKTLYDLFMHAKNSKTDSSLAHIPETLVSDERFYSTLKQALSKTKMVVEEKKDSAHNALKELHTQLHYYKWLNALHRSPKAFNPSRFYGEPFKGLKENLRLLIWSMIHGYDS